jgi:branched-chain amino acid transport system ATP-binding protein
LIEGREAAKLVASNEFNQGDVLLEIDDIRMYFGKVAALAGVSLKVRKGEIHSVIGPNGAGKRTTHQPYQTIQAS